MPDRYWKSHVSFFFSFSFYHYCTFHINCLLLSTSQKRQYWNQQPYFKVYTWSLKIINFSDFFLYHMPICYISRRSTVLLTLGLGHITLKKLWIVETSVSRINNTFHSIILVIYRGYTFLMCYWPLQTPSTLLDLQLQIYIQLFYNSTYFSTKHVQTLYYQKIFLPCELKIFLSPHIMHLLLSATCLGRKPPCQHTQIPSYLHRYIWEWKCYCHNKATKLKEGFTLIHLPGNQISSWVPWFR